MLCQLFEKICLYSIHSVSVKTEFSQFAHKLVSIINAYGCHGRFVPVKALIDSKLSFGKPQSGMAPDCIYCPNLRSSDLTR